MPDKQMVSVFDGIFKDQAGFQSYILAFGKKEELIEPLYRKWFPDLEILETTFDAMIGGQNASVSAAITAWGSVAPLSSDEKVSKRSIETLVIQRGKMRGAKELQQIKNAFLTGNQSINLRKMYDDVLFAKNSIILAKNMLALQLISKGYVVVNPTLNDGGIIVGGNVIDYSIDAAQRVNVSVSWDLTATSDPYKDIKSVVDEADERGVSYTKLLLPQDRINKMLASDSLKTQMNIPLTKGKTGVFSAQYLSLDDVNSFFISMGLPIIEKVTSKIRMETETGGRAMVEVWEAGIGVFIEQDLQGTMNFNTPVEADPRFAINTYVATLDNILIKQYYNAKEVSQQTDGKAICAPNHEASSINILMQTIV